MKNPRISGNSTILLVLSAVFIDMIEVILGAVAIGEILNSIIDVVVTLMYMLWFRAYKVNFRKTRAIIFFGIAALELIPVVNILPLWIIDVVAVIITVRMEDRTGMSATKILNDPRKRKILQKGITKAVNVAANLNPEVKAALAATGWPERNLNQLKGVRNPDNAPDKTREEKIAAQRQNKSNGNNQNQN